MICLYSVDYSYQQMQGSHVYLIFIKQRPVVEVRVGEDTVDTPTHGTQLRHWRFLDTYSEIIYSKLLLQTNLTCIMANTNVLLNDK